MKNIKKVTTEADLKEWDKKLKGVIAKRKARKEINCGLLGLIGLQHMELPEIGKVKKPLKATAQKAS